MGRALVGLAVGLLVGSCSCSQQVSRTFDKDGLGRVTRVLDGGFEDGGEPFVARCQVDAGWFEGGVIVRASPIWRSPRMTGRGVQLTEDALLFGEFDTPDSGNRRQLAGRDFVQLVSDEAWLPKVTRPSGVAICALGQRACLERLRDGGTGRVVASFAIRFWATGGWVVGEAEGGMFQVWAPDGGLQYERGFASGGPSAVSSSGLGVGQVPSGGEAVYLSPDGRVASIDAGEASWASDVSDDGVAVGRILRGLGRASVFCGQRILEAGPLSGSDQEFTAINNQGLAVGVQNDRVSGLRRGFVWFRGAWASLEDLQTDGGPDADCTPLGAYDVNESNQIGVVLQCGTERYGAIWELELAPP